MKALICGDRNWTDKETIRQYLSELKAAGYTEIIEGGARGADTIAKEEALKLHLSTNHFPAQWDKYGRSAGYIRNRVMLDQKPDIVVGFHKDIANSKGTADCLKEAKRRGIITVLIEYKTN
ncbi:hypothetical protein LCGC14_0408790 [marine sediment metagenome]|uniref:YspA cpYpsA-related SLOG domain-containing protein n=1 Tax=marine sediment metagenome TaxID=412755 RepID=A0A0F9TCH6_9ZZZZ